VRRFSSKFQPSIVGELNVTPLLDLAFVLLIVFMIATPFMENNLDLLVPTGSSAKKDTPVNQVQTVKVRRDSSLIFNEKHVTAEELETQLRALYTKDPEIAIIIRAHKELSVQRLVYIVDLLGRVGISKVGVVARQEKHSSHKL
jgi:biopolymer transport protein ExbD